MTLQLRLSVEQAEHAVVEAWDRYTADVGAPPGGEAYRRVNTAVEDLRVAHGRAQVSDGEDLLRAAIESALRWLERESPAMAASTLRDALAESERRR